eukprot:TRINITY_DN5543_c0_g1_i12.p1 TRINITY_DN5543_c0_g1~~TRINITY_DN5543_c0_g1_i12.p1  ORF type:complete len:324 (+),score=2.33 TRINITY_DN5543_c0_g1_i12:333-1304(+)
MRNFYHVMAMSLRKPLLSSMAPPMLASMLAPVRETIIVKSEPNVAEPAAKESICNSPKKTITTGSQSPLRGQIIHVPVPIKRFIRKTDTNQKRKKIKPGKDEAFRFFTAQEDIEILEGYSKYGSAWGYIASKLKNRTAQQVKNRFYFKLRKSHLAKKESVEREMMKGFEAKKRICGILMLRNYGEELAELGDFADLDATILDIDENEISSNYRDVVVGSTMSSSTSTEAESSCEVLQKHLEALEKIRNEINHTIGELESELARPSIGQNQTISKFYLSLHRSRDTWMQRVTTTLVQQQQQQRQRILKNTTFSEFSWNSIFQSQ